MPSSEEKIIRRIRHSLAEYNSIDPSDAVGDIKSIIRSQHKLHRVEYLDKASCFLAAHSSKLIENFANGDEVDPLRIKPRLELVQSDSLESRIFRLATLTWSVPVSEGYGRRMRFLVWDDHNDRLMGVIAIGDPVFNLKVRDELIDWSPADRKKRLVGIMDAFVLGAVPPYNMLLGGKLIACLIRSREVRDAFRRKYAKTTSIISGEDKNPKLLLVTTSSSLGRSSVYNRLKLSNQEYFSRIGYTSGYGHFHVAKDVFSDIRQLLSLRNHPYADGNQFGNGPNWKFRAIRAALELIGFNRQHLKHGIKREVFECCLAKNAHAVLRGTAKRPDYSGLLSVNEIGDLARDRWIIPRAESRHEFKHWKNEQILSLLTT